MCANQHDKSRSPNQGKLCSRIRVSFRHRRSQHGFGVLDGMTLGRKNWLFVPSETGVGRSAAILMSLVASAKANQVEPWRWLRDLFARLPATPADELDALLPDRWLKGSSPQHRCNIDEFRRRERQGKKR